MTPLTQEFVESCPIQGGFRMRGLEMTRIEVFVDAAFAFAVTMLVISFDAMPTSYGEMIQAVKNIPQLNGKHPAQVLNWQLHPQPTLQS